MMISGGSSFDVLFAVFGLAATATAAFALALRVLMGDIDTSDI
jgi:hypothetical protein